MSSFRLRFFRMHSFHSPFFLKNVGKQSDIVPELLFRRTTMLCNFKIAPTTGKSTSMGSMCSPWAPDTTLRYDWDRMLMLLLLMNLLLSSPARVEQRRSEQPIEAQLSIVNPQQPNSCHPTQLHLPPSRCTSDNIISAAPPPACTLVPDWSAQAQIKPGSNVLTLTGKEAVVRDFQVCDITNRHLWFTQQWSDTILSIWASVKGSHPIFFLLPQGGVSDQKHCFPRKRSI